MSQLLDADYIKAYLERIDTTTRNNHTLLIEIRDLDLQLVDAVKNLGAEVNSLQAGESINTQKLVGLSAKIDRIVRIMERTQAIRSNLGAGY